jgi:hypothetical protein
MLAISRRNNSLHVFSGNVAVRISGRLAFSEWPRLGGCGIMIAEGRAKTLA